MQADIHILYSEIKALRRRLEKVEETFCAIEEVCDQFTRDETGTVYDLAHSICRIMPADWDVE